jgi:serine phosphatase RsbU (regulator of sigma subunit)
MRRYFLQTLPGRAIVVGLAIKLTLYALSKIGGGLPPFLSVVDTVAGLAVAAGGAYFVFRLVILAQRRLLWRVRRKLILSYIFVGVVPAALIVLFFLLTGFLLFYNLSSYLVQSRLRAIADQGRFIAQSTALEIQRAGGRDVAAIIARRQTTASEQFPGISIAVVPANRTCTDGVATDLAIDPSNAKVAAAGPWSHVTPPQQLPSWVPCAGFGGVLAYTDRTVSAVPEQHVHLLVRGVAFPDASHSGYAVIVDLLVDDAVRRQLRDETGVDVKGATAIDPTTTMPGRPLTGLGDHEVVPAESAPQGSLLQSVPSPMEYYDWNTGSVGLLRMRSAISIPDLYDRISAAEGRLGRRFGQGLLVILFVIGALFLIIQVIAALAGFSLAKSITGSVHELFTGTERVRQGDFTHKIAVRSNDQLGELATSFNQMTASIEDLLREAAEKKRLEEELRIAHEIQMSLLPQGPLRMRGVSVTALCVPAREVGGDYYDLLPLDDHRLGVLIADVSGKGTSAALYMAELKGLVLSLSRIHESPRDLLVHANRLIAEHLDARSFITMTYAVLDLQKGTMTYARAGHTPLIYVPGAPGSHAQILVPDGLVLGLKIDNGELFERLLQEETIDLRAGDLFVLFTDGISEAMNARDDCFGEGRLGQLVERHARLASDELRERVLREISAFVGDAPQHDDMTMILLKIDEVVEAVA